MVTTGPVPGALRRLRLELDNHDSDLLIVGDVLYTGGQYVQLEIPRSTSHAWTWLEWDAAYDRLERAWHARFGRSSKVDVSGFGEPPGTTTVPGQP